MPLHVIVVLAVGVKVPPLNVGLPERVSVAVPIVTVPPFVQVPLTVKGYAPMARVAPLVVARLVQVMDAPVPAVVVPAVILNGPKDVE